MFRHKLYIRYQGRDVYAVFEQGQTVFIGQLHDCKEYIREVTKKPFKEILQIRSDCTE